METLNKTKSTFGASSTRTEQAEFTAFVNTLSVPRAAATVSKRAPGRPPGSRGRVLFLPLGLNARGFFALAHEHYFQALRFARFSAVNIRRFGRLSWLGLQIRQSARVEVALSLCYLLAAFCMIKGGVL